MAIVSYLRPKLGDRPAATRRQNSPGTARKFGRGRYLLGGGLLIVLAVVAVGALVFGSAHASLTSDPTALAKVGLPLGGGSIESVTVVTGPHSRRVPVQLRGDQIWPTGLIRAGSTVSVQVVVKRPGWISWIAGKTQTLRLTLSTPVASLRSHYLTLGARAPLRLRFKQPVSAIAYGAAGHLQRHLLPRPRSIVTLPRSAAAGTIFVAAQPRTWESSSDALVSWFPSGSTTTAVADPAPGSQIQAGTPITLTFSKTVASALGSHRPPVSPVTQGTWHTVNSHQIQFRPQGYGYGIGTGVNIALPTGVKLIGGQQNGTANGGSWSVPAGSTLRLQQMLALLGYLPLNFHYAGSGGVPRTPQAQEQAAIKPPAGRFTWRWSNVPPALRGFWAPGASGEVTRGALMAFETDHNLLADGIPGAAVWRTLFAAVVSGHRSTFGYTFVSVNEATQSLDLWHNGDTVLNTPVNTGIASAPTATGTYPVYEHLPVTTMSGTNPDGSHYSDPGIQWVSYFNGGDALHGFTRAQYGFPQSLGCVEMPVGTAGQVYPYTPVGTLVHVT